MNPHSTKHKLQIAYGDSVWTLSIFYPHLSLSCPYPEAQATKSNTKAITLALPLPRTPSPDFPLIVSLVIQISEKMSLPNISFPSPPCLILTHKMEKRGHPLTVWIN